MDFDSCPNCKVPMLVDVLEEALIERFLENGYMITQEGLKAFIERCVEEFGEISVDDVDAFCEFVSKRYNTKTIDEKIVNEYFTF